MSLSIRPTLSIFWQHIRRHPWLALTFTVAIVIVNVLDIFVPLISKRFFDTLASDLTGSAMVDAAMTVVWMLFWLWLARWALYRIATFVGSTLQPLIMSELELTAFSNLVDHSYRFHTSAFSGAMVRKVKRFADAFGQISDQIMWSLTMIVISLVGVLIIFYTRNPLIALLLGGWSVVFVLANIVISVWKLKYDTRRSELDSEATGVLSDALSNMVTIKQFSGKAYELGVFERVMRRWQKAQTLSWNLGNINETVQALLMIFLETACLYYAVRFYAEGTLTIGDLALIQIALFALFEKLWDFGRVIRHLYEGFADAKEMADILHAPFEVEDKSGAKKLKVKQGSIVFDDVSFSYNPARPVLDHFTLTITADEKVAFVGSSGAGKSTIIKVLLRFFDVKGGRILIDGQDIAKVTQESLREAIAVVPQDPILFHRSLMENIRYGRRSATDDEVIDAAKKAHCHEFISQLPQGYATLVGERGVKLSGGERQRIAIARAILKNAPILILDEATSSLDSESEALIQDALKELMRGKTVIVIAHRLSTIMQMDRIVVIEKGTVTDSGKHAELIKKQGTYSRLWSIQAGGFLP